MIYVKEYTRDHFEELLNFCKSQSVEDTPASKNMWQSDWQDKPETLLYILSKTDRFRNGKFFLLLEDDNIIGCSGIYISNFSEHVAIAGARTWLDKKYRTKRLVNDYLLTNQRTWAIDNGISVVALTFNEYNAGIVRMYRIGMASEKITNKHMFSSNFNILEYPVRIQNTQQWVVYENLNDYKFDWAQLREDF